MEPFDIARLKASLLPLNELKEELNALENGSFLSMNDEELQAKVWKVHEGFLVKAPIVGAGKLIFRAVKVTGRPATKSRISYPPSGAIHNYGRANGPGEAMFYGSFNQFTSCLYECNAQTGDFFAVSAWLTTKSMTFNHLGYSASVLKALKTNRETPFFAIFEEDSERDIMIREWQARVFTQIVPEGNESQYRLPITLKEFALGGIVKGSEPIEMQFSGIIYPSIAMWQLTDNVAILPSEVDSKMALIEVALLVLDYPSIESINGLGGRQTEVHVKSYEFARADERGNLVWGQKSQLFPEIANGVIPDSLSQLPPA